MANSHYISRFLTRPWEHGKCKLTYFSFETQKFQTSSSKRLYAVEGLFDDRLETFLSGKIESIAASERDAIIAGNTDLTKWKSYKAVFLLMLLQGGRSSSANTGDASDFSKILNFSDDALTMMVVEAQKQFQLVSINAPAENNRLFYPDTGIFPALCVSRGTPTWIICMPFGPITALALRPLSVELDSLKHLAERAFLTNFSVGTSASCKRVVIHPDVLGARPEAELASAILDLRRQTDEQIANVNRLNDLQANLHETVKQIIGAIS